MNLVTLSQVVKGGDGLELKILLFLSFQIAQRMNPGSSCHMRWRIGLWKETTSQLARVSRMLLRFL
jgi:hypothetical protein